MFGRRIEQEGPQESVTYITDIPDMCLRLLAWRAGHLHETPEALSCASLLQPDRHDMKGEGGGGRDCETAQLQVGARIRHARILKGMRMRDLALAVGYDESMISKIEAGKVTRERAAGWPADHCPPPRRSAARRRGGGVRTGAAVAGSETAGFGVAARGTGQQRAGVGCGTGYARPRPTIWVGLTKRSATRSQMSVVTM